MLTEYYYSKLGDNIKKFKEKEQSYHV